MELDLNSETGISERDELNGIGGWLILVAIGIVLTPIRLALATAVTFGPIFTNGSWEAMTTPGSEAFSPYWGPIIVTEILVNLAMLLISFVLVALFFTKKRLFPRLYVGFAIFSFLVVIVDAYAVTLVLPAEQVFTQETAMEISRSLVMLCIWVPYMLISQRVKSTFVR